MPQAGKRNQLLEDGYCLFERVLPPEMVARLREVTERLLQRQLPEDFERARATGSMIPTTGDPFFAELIAWPGAP